jgi:hypothetical protein
VIWRSRNGLPAKRGIFSSHPQILIGASAVPARQIWLRQKFRPAKCCQLQPTVATLLLVLLPVATT